MTMERCKNVVLASCLSLGLLLPAASQAAEASKVVESCFSCHGKNGNSADPDIPNIASYSEEYLTKTLQKYKNKERPCVETEIRDGADKGKKSDMCKVAAKLSDDDVTQLAEFFVAQTFERTPQKFDPELAAKGKSVHNKRCYTCHSEGGSQPSDHAGILAGQKMNYLREQLKYFKEGKRPINKKMKPKLEATDDAELEAVVQYYGSLK